MAIRHRLGLSLVVLGMACSAVSLAAVSVVDDSRRSSSPPPSHSSSSSRPAPKPPVSHSPPPFNSHPAPMSNSRAQSLPRPSAPQSMPRPAAGGPRPAAGMPHPAAGMAHTNPGSNGVHPPPLSAPGGHAAMTYRDVTRQQMPANREEGHTPGGSLVRTRADGSRAEIHDAHRGMDIHYGLDRKSVV